MACDHTTTDPATQARLIDAVCDVVSRHGVDGATAQAVCQVAGLALTDLFAAYPSMDDLVVDAASVMAHMEVFPAIGSGRLPPTVGATFEALAAAHRAYVDRFPQRFAMFALLASPAALGRAPLATLLSMRTRRSKAAVRQRLWAHRARADIDPRIDPAVIASAVVNCFVGIELCFLFDGDRRLRERTYDEAVAVFNAVLNITPPAS